MTLGHLGICSEIKDFSKTTRQNWVKMQTKFSQNSVKIVKCSQFLECLKTEKFTVLFKTFSTNLHLWVSVQDKMHDQSNKNILL